MEYIQVPTVYLVSDRIKTREEKERLKRMLEKIDAGVTISLEAKHLNELINKSGWYSKDKRTGQKRQGNPNIIFSGFDWDDERNNPSKLKRNKAYALDKFSFADFRNKYQLRKEKGAMCNSGYEIHTAFGCLFSCGYCHVGNALTIMLDIEGTVDKLAILMRNNSWQKLYKYDNQSDIMALEPEYGAAKELVEFFSKTNKYLMLYTKSDNTNFLLNLEHKGQTIVCWTISCNDVAKRFEHGAPNLEERLKAAKKCREAGYRVRFRFSPIIPVKDWESKNKEMLAKVFSEVKPEVISLETLCHMTKEQFDEIFTDLEFKPQERITEYELFSHKDRLKMYEFFLKEIKRHDSKVKIALCLETPRMWKELSDLLKQSPENFYCCCGAKCV